LYKRIGITALSPHNERILPGAVEDVVTQWVQAIADSQETINLNWAINGRTSMSQLEREDLHHGAPAVSFASPHVWPAVGWSRQHHWLQKG